MSAEIEIGPEELQERIAAVRNAWTEAERAARRRGVFVVDDWQGFRSAVERQRSVSVYRLLCERN